jgi:hypothetical protein
MCRCIYEGVSREDLLRGKDLPQMWIEAQLEEKENQENASTGILSLCFLI